MIQFYRDYVTKAPKRSPFWARTRREKKKRNPTCEACGRGGRWLIAVHHILPFHLFPEKELDPENLISLCAWCHFILGHLRNWKSFNRYVRRDAAMLLMKIKYRP